MRTKLVSSETELDGHLDYRDLGSKNPRNRNHDAANFVASAERSIAASGPVPRLLAPVQDAFFVNGAGRITDARATRTGGDLWGLKFLLPMVCPWRFAGQISGIKNAISSRFYWRARKDSNLRPPDS